MAGGTASVRFAPIADIANFRVGAKRSPLGHDYAIGGKQFVVIAAGGSSQISEEGRGDAIVAFSLP